jgi:hypothetical protein
VKSRSAISTETAPTAAVSPPAKKVRARDAAFSRKGGTASTRRLSRLSRGYRYRASASASNAATISASTSGRDAARFSISVGSVSRSNSIQLSKSIFVAGGCSETTFQRPRMKPRLPSSS